MKKQRIHFIAIGGSAMHNLAIALHKKGHNVSGSDDEIFDPSKSRLQAHNLLPEDSGWHPEKITTDIDAIILGMHAKKDNPELLRAQKLEIPVYSYPEYLYKQTQNKKRIAIAGSHGKTTTTAMVMHVLKYAGIRFDYMVGASLNGFDTMVNLEEKNDLAVFEADEYLSSPIDMRSKFLWYKPHISVITGIAWDHINVFPTFESYLDTFQKFLETIPQGGKLFYFEKDEHIQTIIKKTKNNIELTPYQGLKKDNATSGNIKLNDDVQFSAPIFGDHNLQNMQAAYFILKELGISDRTFIDAMQNFKGANRRLQVLKKGEYPVYYDFAHAPSKVKATLKAVKDKHPDKKILAILELHTFSSLNKKFIPHYKKSMNPAYEALVYFNPKTLEHKGMPALDNDFIQASFEHKNLHISNNSEEIANKIITASENEFVVLIMTSGNFNGLDFSKLS